MSSDLNGTEVRTGGCTVVPDDLGRAAASDQGHRVGRPPTQYMVPSYAAVLFAYRQHCRFVQAEATTLPAMNSKQDKNADRKSFFESVTDTHELSCVHAELSCVYAELGML